MTRSELHDWLTRRIAEELGIDPGKVDAQTPFEHFGISSIAAVGISGDLEQLLGRTLRPVLLWEYPSIAQLAAFLAEEPAAAAAAALPAAAAPQGQGGGAIAIVGMGCRYPGAHGVEAFWRLLRDGIDAIGDVPADRWDAGAYYHPDPFAPGKMYVRRGGFIDDIDRFDAGFFGIPPREASRMDPQQRIALETAWETLEHAGIAPASLAGSATGVFLGISSSDFAQTQFGDAAAIDAYIGTGNAHSVAANRISYLLDLRGPSVAVDTACSSSLVAVHQAVRALRAGECDLALAGGVNALLSPEVTVIFAQARMLSPDGRCKTFDAAADGYVRAEGCGFVALKRLEDAQRDGDAIYAVVRGTAINHDGRSNGLTAPSGHAQQAVIRAALRDAGAAPHEVGCIEAHGTGTALGDPIEMDALLAAYAEGRAADNPLAVGSVKTNMGHLEAAAGVAGLMKAALALHHRTMPAHLHFRRWNPAIDLRGLPVIVPMATQPWQGPLRAGVSSFGFGGANAHAVVEAAPEAAPAPASERALDRVLTLSARGEPALRAMASRWADAIEAADEADIAALCFTANTRRARFAARLAVPALKRDKTAAELRKIAEGGGAIGGARPRLVWLFTGQGSQYAGMAKALYDGEPVFRAALDRCAAVLDGPIGRPFLPLIFSTDDPALIDHTQYAQPALFAVEYALAELLRAWGLAPDAVLGHSVGEYGAACAAGAFAVEDGLRLIAARGRLMGALPAGGKMAAILAAPERVSAALEAAGGGLAIAGFNGPANTVISGAGDAVDALVASLEAEKVKCRPLAVSHAFHSPLIAPMLEALEAEAARVDFRPIKTPLACNLTGALLPAGHVFDAAYWPQHARGAVQFESGIAALCAQGPTLFLEIGPQPVLAGMGAQCNRDKAHQWIGALRKGEDDGAALAAALAKVHAAGIDVDWDAVHRGPARRVVAAPVYAFGGERYAAVPPRAVAAAAPPAAAAPEAVAPMTPEELCYAVTWEIAHADREAAPRAPGQWILLADAGGTMAALARALEARGHRAHLAAADAAPREALAALDAALPLHGVVHGANLDLSLEAEADGAAFARIEALGCGAALEWVRALDAAHKAKDAPQAACARLWLLSRGAQAVDGSEPAIAVAQAPVWGLGRTIALEVNAVFGALADLDPRAPHDDVALLAAALCGPRDDDQIAFRGGARHAARLRRAHAALDGAHAPFAAGGGAWVVTGGLGGLALIAAEWLADRGATHLALIGRTPLPPRDAWDGVPATSTPGKRIAAVRALEARGVTVETAAIDTGDADALAAWIEGYRARVPRLEAVLHAAGVAQDAPVSQQDAAALHAVFHPKAPGAWRLHQLCRGADAPRLLLYSSASAVLGSPGQANYAAANAFLDALAQQRRLEGLPALALDWGPWAEAGMAAGTAFGHRLAQRGIHSLAPRDALAALERLIGGGAPQVCVMAVDWERLRRMGLGAVDAPYLRAIFDEIGAAAQRPEPVSGAQAGAAVARGGIVFAAGSAGARVYEARGEARVAAVAEFLHARVAAVLHADPAAVSRTDDFKSQGMDSIMLMELIDAIESAIRLKLFPNEVIDRPNIADLAAYIANELRDDTASEDAAPAAGGRTRAAGASRLRVTLDRDRYAYPKPGTRNPPAIFILSGPRVGSTLFRVMLAGHERLFVPPELHLLPFHSMAERARELEGSYLAEGLQRAVMELKGLDAEEAKAVVDEWAARDAPTQEVYAALQQWCAPRILVDKSPSYASSVDILERAEDLFEGAQYVHLARHPYAAIESFLRNRFDRFVYDSARDAFGLAEEVWATTNSNVCDFFNAVGDARKYFMKYEDLVEDPERAMRGLCRFLALPYTDALVNPYDGGRMTDGVHEKSFSIGDPNFLQHKGVDAKLGRAWRKVRFGRRLGGFAQRVARELGYELPHEGGAAGAPAFQHLVPIKPGGSRPAFYCVAPGGGIVFPYFNIRPHLHPEQPFYGLQDPGNDPANDIASSIPDTAAEHIRALRLHQPRGPYCLGGWSYGGAVAFEMARQLVEQGETVDLVAMIDTEAPVAAPAAGWSLRRLRTLAWSYFRIAFAIAGLSWPYIRDGFYLVFASARRSSAPGQRPSIGEYVRWGWTDLMRHHLLRSADVEDLVKRDSRLLLVRQPSTRRVLQVLRANLAALKAYRPAPYPGTITVFRAKDQSALRRHAGDPTLGWAHLARKTDVVELPGNHVVLFLKPLVEALARELCARIEAAARR